MEMLISGGHVIDPAAGVDEVRDVHINNGRVTGKASGGPGCKVVDARGCHVFPGLIDFHNHVFWGGSYYGMSPDLLLSTGVTTVVDAGTTGCANFEAFHRSVVSQSLVRVKAQLHLHPVGIPGYDINERYDFDHLPHDKIAALLERYGDTIVGFKMRMGRESLEGQAPGVEPLRRAVAVGEKYGLPLAVHGSNPPCTASEFVEVLRKGDVFCHFYHGKGLTVLDDAGKVQKKVKEAQKRGVLLDASNGVTNFSIDVAKAAIADGLYPDIISTDDSPPLFNHPYFAKNLAFVMSKYLALGLSLGEVVKAATEVPAAAMGMSGSIGTLAEGAWGDVAIFRMVKADVEYRDNLGKVMRGGEILLPRMTIMGGEVLFCQNDFYLCSEARM